jgi:hypothetical protein
MKLGPVAVGMVLVTIAFSGCGGSSTPSSATTASTGKGSAATTLPAGTPAALRDAHGGMLVAGELPGFVPQGTPTLGTRAESWVAGEGVPPEKRAAETASLRAFGFVAGVEQRLAPSHGGTGEGISIVELFRSSHGASAEMASALKQAAGRGETTFAAPGIPGGRGFGSSAGNANVEFSVGPYYYVVGDQVPSSTPPIVVRAQLVAAAESLYRRVRG